MADRDATAAAPALKPLPEDWDRALAVVAHPDDLEYGAASAIARWTAQGKTVTYLLVTRGEAGIDRLTPEQAGPLRAEEERRSAATVGVKVVEFLGYEDGLIEYGRALRRDIVREIRRHRPNILIALNYELTWGGGPLNMADHRWTGLAVLDAARDAANRWIFRELLDEGLEPWGGVRFVCVAGSARATHAVDVTGFLDRGIASLREHRVYLDNLAGDFDPATFLTEITSAVGQVFGSEHAVSFEVIEI